MYKSLFHVVEFQAKYTKQVSKKKKKKERKKKKNKTVLLEPFGFLGRMSMFTKEYQMYSTGNWQLLKELGCH